MFVSPEPSLSVFVVVVMGCRLHTLPTLSVKTFCHVTYHVT